MKVFISWSGELSKKIAEILKRKIPCIIQSVEVFYSSNDIQKGENWDAKLVDELASCNFGIVCLTQENVNAPWVHFESGALSKALDSRVSALLIDINPSELKGPLSKFQNTKIDKEDFKLLMTSINNATESKLSKEVLEETFEMVWKSIDEEIKSVLSSVKPSMNQPQPKASQENSQAIEEILVLLRKQNNILSDPEQFIPQNYLARVLTECSRKMPLNSRRINVDNRSTEEFIYEIVRWMENVGCACENSPYMREMYSMLEFDRLVSIILSLLDHSSKNDFSIEFLNEMRHKLFRLRDFREPSISDNRDIKLGYTKNFV
ncbi:toll/interleukin-1 receptor domain-containing protein [Paludicola sp. MB14-C6]|uniref:toll/interleukin-1 receptor domain-containing protein n=1 Tax=Paludihabitans sp. MB14-C6 TaxID=3070656 RepID=UPI0027DB405D|nr:toll/interleukin-1 receptor domain-containing protein [Paludicola sp. MB14-C6]WMJ22192.1 toll/interleukin-1 receptor domain-containing protein [Paludicola sp. MB14-C6]